VGRLYRCVPQLHFDGGRPPTYFFASRMANRCNPAGVECLYLSEDEATASAEYRSAWKGLPAEHQPKLTYVARVRLAHILDLDDADVSDSLQLKENDFYGSWRLRGRTRLQSLGLSISLQKRIVAIRFPSAAARSERTAGWNLALFKAALAAPDRVEILGDGTRPLEVLP
jgi:RES domain-containing protein